MGKDTVTVDANEAVARVAYKLSEVIAIYPITPSSAMGEFSDEYMSREAPNVWGELPRVFEMQSEGGAAGAVHGALMGGALTCTFTASQGLLLMIPNMLKIAGELTPCVIHVAARSLAYHALSIFGDHSDVMSVRSTGWGMLCSNSVQEAQDLAAISHGATLDARIPLIHFFDGFRTSHEVSKFHIIDNHVLTEMIDPTNLEAFRSRRLRPEAPMLKGSAQNPDVYFQSREACQPYYEKLPAIVQAKMDKFAKLTGRQYHLFDFEGADDAERVIVQMGSGAETTAEAVAALTSLGEKVGILKVRLYRPLDIKALVKALPTTVKAIAVLDRTKESGGQGEPLYQDLVAGLSEALQLGQLPWKSLPTIVGGRFGLSSKEFTPSMARAVFDNLKSERPRRHFTVGIKDDLSNSSLDCLPWNIESEATTRAVFYGLGSDGTVGANKNSIKIIGEETDLFAQGYFVYDSKKAGSRTVSHLRFGPKPIRSSYLITSPGFVASHQPQFIDKIFMLDGIQPGGTFLVNSALAADKIWDSLPLVYQQTILDKKIKFWAIDADAVAGECGMPRRINTVMQVCFFKLAGVLPVEDAVKYIKKSIVKTYSSKGDEVVAMNLRTVDLALERLVEISHGKPGTGLIRQADITLEEDDFVRNVLGEIVSGRGDNLPTSAMPQDGTFPTHTSRYEKSGLTTEIPVWNADICIQCNKCALVCPHSAIRPKLVGADDAAGAPEGFTLVDPKDPNWKKDGFQFTLQVSGLDCTGCTLCVVACPVRDKQDPGKRAINMESFAPLRENNTEHWKYFERLPEFDREKIKAGQVRQSQLLQPLFEFSGACAGCGETPYLKLVSQLFGDRMIIANATGCSSIYGGNLPTTPWAKTKEGRGPAWANSLFEDNAEFGLGMRVAIDRATEAAKIDLWSVSGLPENLVRELVTDDPIDEAGVMEQRRRMNRLREIAAERNLDIPILDRTLQAIERKSLWIMGGDGWAYDIGFGGLDHVMASGEDVNILVLDTEVYSNTGGQMSKSTPLGAIAKFAGNGKKTGKKDLARMAMSYGNVYVARVALGANDAQVIKALMEAESYRGPSIVIAYAHCVAHGFAMKDGLEHQKMMVETGQLALFRFDPRRISEGKIPFQLDCREPSRPLSDLFKSEGRFRQLTRSNPEVAASLLNEAEKNNQRRWKMFKQMAEGGRSPGEGIEVHI